MSDDVLVRVEGVGKKFCRDLKKSLWYGMKDIAAELLPGERDLERHATLRSGEFWAVDDVSLELRRRPDGHSLRCKPIQVCVHGVASEGQGRRSRSRAKVKVKGEGQGQGQVKGKGQDRFRGLRATGAGCAAGTPFRGTLKPSMGAPAPAIHGR